MAFIMIGSIACSLVNQEIKPAEALKSAAVNCEIPQMEQDEPFGWAGVEEEKVGLFDDCATLYVPARVQDGWRLDDQAFNIMSKYVKFTKEGERVLKQGWQRYRKYLQHFAYTYTIKLKEEARRMLRDSFAFRKTQIVTHITTNDEPQIRCGEEPKPTINNEKPNNHFKVQKKTLKPVRHEVSKLISQLAKLTATGEIKELQIIGKKRKRIITANRIYLHAHDRLKLSTKHEQGQIKPIDLMVDLDQKPLLDNLCNVYANHNHIQSCDVSQGMSGAILSCKETINSFIVPESKYFIVRGRLHGNLVDSRLRLSTQSLIEIQHYSSERGKQFWESFETFFIQHRKTVDEHACSSDFDIRKCGQLAAIVTMIFNRCGRITCKKCAENLTDLDVFKYCEQVQQSLDQWLPLIKSEYSEFTHVLQFLEYASRVAENANITMAPIDQIQQMIGDRKEAPFTHLLAIKDGLIGLLLTSRGNANDVLLNLLEVVRWHKNRTEHIKAGSLISFRNKVSGKTQLNVALMCDNQLDQNGNYIWGLRGKAAARFFKNYFEVVSTQQDYSQYVLRKHPNGFRKLAIGNLIMPTDLELLRKQLKGDECEQPPVSDACVARLNGNFVYPCCCVTLDDGKALKSDFKAPTKHHLVIGNTGDSKFVDLPEFRDNRMFIPKEGYCYILIFLAMMVNVNERDAKDFTKTVRDLVVPKLKTWPKMIDLATSCHFLSVLFPETRNAELPRILVDHVHSTFHVIDSYGSVTTGYHVLKANTVSQLIQFASDDLESDMKSYLVGGRSKHVVVEEPDDDYFGEDEEWYASDVAVETSSESTTGMVGLFEENTGTSDEIQEMNDLENGASHQQCDTESTSTTQSIPRDVPSTSQADNAYKVTMEEFNINKAWTLLKVLIQAIYRPEQIKTILLSEPYLLVLAVVSPNLMKAMYDSGTLAYGIKIWLKQDLNIAYTLALLEDMASRILVSDCYVEQMSILERGTGPILERMHPDRNNSSSYAIAYTTLCVMLERSATNKDLEDIGFYASDSKMAKFLEKNYTDELAISWRDLTFAEKLRSISFSFYQRSSLPNLQEIRNVSTRDCAQIFTACVQHFLVVIYVSVIATRSSFSNGVRKAIIRVKESARIAPLKMLQHALPFIFKHISTLAVIGLIFTVFVNITILINEFRRYKIQTAQLEYYRREKQLYRYFDAEARLAGERMVAMNEEKFVEGLPKELQEHFHNAWKKEGSKEQAKNKEERKLEQIIAFMALAAMMFSPGRSDGVFKILNKIKTIFSTTEETTFQSIDTIHDILESKASTVDFELSDSSMFVEASFDASFNAWWENQLQNSNTIPHYRTGGKFVEFTRKRAQIFCSDIENAEESEFLIRGEVGSGKSTNIPNYLSQKGRVLVIEPTRPLAENVCEQLRRNPFFCSPSLFMRNVHVGGSSPIDIMTSGFALHALANKREDIANYKYIMFDESHVLDSNAMAFYCLLKEVCYSGKILKVSATPPGRECEFKTQYPVEVRVEHEATFQQFVAAQGTGANMDVIRNGNNILVYVASYNDVDVLSKLLSERGFLVTKVDGRTMKSGKTEIVTKGHQSKQHFVVATNIIENGVTLDIDVVVDFGVKVVAELDSDTRKMSYRKVSVSFGERVQRLGRVGRFQKGTALRIGHTEMGLMDIPVSIATEAAYLSFAYSLPVMTHNVSTSLLGNTTKRQARTALQFELPIYVTAPLVANNGSMHPNIHEILKPFKLRASKIELHELAFQVGHTSQWLSVHDYIKLGVNTNCELSAKLPFYSRDIPDKIYERLWTVIHQIKANTLFRPMSIHNASKIAYTLKSDPASIQFSIALIDQLIIDENLKRAHLRQIGINAATASSMSLANLIHHVSARYAVDYTGENIETLQRIRARLLELSNISPTGNYVEAVRNYPEAEYSTFQTKEKLAQAIGLKGQWNGSLITRDLAVCGIVLVGGIWMTYEHFLSRMNEDVSFEAQKKMSKSKRENFEQQRGKRMAAFQLHNDSLPAERSDFGLEEDFEREFKSHGKKKGKFADGDRISRSRKFYHIYGFDPADYNIVRFVDPLTGATIDEHPLKSMEKVQKYLQDVRMQMLNNDEIETQHLYSNPVIHAYFMKGAGKNALKVDLTPHDPLHVCSNGASIAGFMDMKGHLRQTGKARQVKFSEVPTERKVGVVQESLSIHRGVRDYNSIATSICLITNQYGENSFTSYGICYGPYIITNRHLFRVNNGSMRVQSHHGVFKIANTTQLHMAIVDQTDILLIKMPKDYPVMPQKLRFRQPRRDDKVLMVGTNFQEKSMSSTVSEASAIQAIDNCAFWRHWISTKDGQCGLPFVCSRDGFILGIHSMSSLVSATNFFAPFSDTFEEEYLHSADTIQWMKQWRYNPDLICWGHLDVKKGQPDGMFKISKLISDLTSEVVTEQTNSQGWVRNVVEDNLQPIALCPGNLVTKHVFKGECPLFRTYLGVDEGACKFFSPLMNFYGKSRLNKEAFLLDFTKYSKEIPIGGIEHDIFEKGFWNVTKILEDAGMEQCDFVTDAEAIFNSLNMKASVGALYTGKKKEYFVDYTDEMRERILFESCMRVYQGKMGIWNAALKAELRKIEKVNMNKTRTFTAAPLDTLLCGKVCVDDFNNQFYDCCIKGPWTVGMTKFYRGWDELYNKLPDGWVYCDADGSQFDSSLTPFLINSVLRLRKLFTEDWHIGQKLLENYYTEIIYTPIATPDGTIIKKYKGNNSGQPSTVVDNTLMVILAMQYALLSEGVELHQQKEVCQYFVNGDDLLIALEPQRAHSLLDTFKDRFSQVGMNYDFSSRTTNKLDLEYMSHKAILLDKVYIPKLARERIVSILQWDKSCEPEQRLEAICAAMIEAWGYPELLQEIRRFYAWVLEQAPYCDLVKEGKAPYIAETALRKLYLDTEVQEEEILHYLMEFQNIDLADDGTIPVIFQSTETINAGEEQSRQMTRVNQERDVNAGSSGTVTLPEVKLVSSKVKLPKIRGKTCINLDHLLTYKPQQEQLYNTKSSQEQLDNWFEGVKQAYEVTDEQMQILLNGLIVWCVENGTSSELTGTWRMQQGDEQKEYDIRPVLAHSQPSFRQIMRHFSKVAEAYIAYRNQEERYMPRIALQRGLTDIGLARYSFDFYDKTAATPVRAREAIAQMTAAALRGKESRLFTLDGNVSTSTENTERHTVEDVTRDMHSLLGVRGVK